MNIYGLSCVGMDNLGGGRFSIVSRKLFTSIAGAEAYIPEFKKKCISGDYLVSVEDNDLISITIIRYELEDSNDTM